MIHLSLINGGMKLISALLEYADKRQMLDAGQAQSVADGLQKLRDQVAQIQAARRDLTDDDRKRLRDKYRADDDPLNRM